jgi:3-methylcrotonyl-CoA carboxylase beta subunit
MNIEFNKNEDAMKMSLSMMEKRLERIYEGGGKKSIQKQREKNKLTARERIDYLIDNDKPFLEIGAFAGYEMYEQQGGCPAGGTVAGVGYVSDRQCVIVANDQTVKAGAYRSFTWLTVPVFFFRCRMKFFRIKNTSEEFFVTMRR